MNNSDLKKEWMELSKEWIREMREGRNSMREGLLDAYVIEACGDVKGKNVLDCGCGEGRFCRILQRMSAAFILGIDLCPLMIQAAKELRSDRESYVIGDAQDLGFLKDESFHLVVSYLNQCDLPDFSSNNSEVYRILSPGGRFVLVNLHPMRTSVGGWQRGDEGEKAHVILDNYFQEGERHWRILGIELTNFHRTLTTYLDDILSAGFRIHRIVEPTTTKQAAEDYPELEDELRVPNFIIYLLSKPE